MTRQRENKRSLQPDTFESSAAAHDFKHRGTMDGPAGIYSAMGCKAVFSRHSLQEQRVLQTELVHRKASKCTLTLLVTDNLTMMLRYHVAPVDRGGQVSLRALFA